MSGTKGLKWSRYDEGQDWWREFTSSTWKLVNKNQVEPWCPSGTERKLNKHAKINQKLKSHVDFP